MLETITFPVVQCNSCGKRALAAQDLDTDGELVLACTSCGSHDVQKPMYLGASALEGLGYTVEGEKESAGCGTGDSGCGSCSKFTSCGV